MGIATMPPDSKDWWAKKEWTEEHFRLARQLMGKIHVLPHNWDDDVIQEVALRYQKARSTGKGRDYRAWLRAMLYHQAVDIYRKELHKRMKEENRPIFVSLESLPEMNWPRK